MCVDAFVTIKFFYKSNVQVDITNQQYLGRNIWTNMTKGEGVQG